MRKMEKEGDEEFIKKENKKLIKKCNIKGCCHKMFYMPKEYKATELFSDGKKGSLNWDYTGELRTKGQMCGKRSELCLHMSKYHPEVAIDEIPFLNPNRHRSRSITIDVDDKSGGGIESSSASENESSPNEKSSSESESLNESESEYS